MDDAIVKFRGLGKEVKDANPVFSTVDKAAGTALALLKGTRSNSGGGQTAMPITVPLPQDAKKTEKKPAVQMAVRRPQPQPETPWSHSTAPQPVAILAVLPPCPDRETAITTVSAGQLAAIRPGLDKTTVLASLGNPSSFTSISGGDEGTRETYIYHLDRQHAARIRLVGGRVTSVSQ